MARRRSQAQRWPLLPAVSETRKLLGGAFQRDRDTYALDREQLRIDLDDLDRLRGEGEARTGEQQQASFERALALFRGRPLSGMEALWSDLEARRLCTVEVELLELIGRLRLQRGDVAGALEMAERSHALDASNERAIQLAMEADATLGRREAVVARYEQLRRDLDERFGLEPSHETKMLYRSILSQDGGERVENERHVLG